MSNDVEVREIQRRVATCRWSYAREFEFYQQLADIPHAFVVFDKQLLKSYAALVSTT